MMRDLRVQRGVFLPDRRRLAVSGQLDDGLLRLGPAADDGDRAEDCGDAEPRRVEDARDAAHGEVRRGCRCRAESGDGRGRERACRAPFSLQATALDHSCKLLRLREGAVEAIVPIGQLVPKAVDRLLVAQPLDLHPLESPSRAPAPASRARPSRRRPAAAAHAARAAASPRRRRRSGHARASVPTRVRRVRPSGLRRRRKTRRIPTRRRARRRASRP